MISRLTSLLLVKLMTTPTLIWTSSKARAASQVPRPRNDVAEQLLLVAVIAAIELRHQNGVVVPMVHELFATPVAYVGFLVFSLSGT